MGRILSLPEALRSQIAAGEVVERAASVAKELIENSLDAGAKAVSVEMEAGGLLRLVVNDDGRGMDPEDAVACLGRHATSKLTSLDGLMDLHTYGFRGEALPSVASVSRLTLTTREAGAEVATRVRVEGGKLLGVEPCGASVGTRVEVRDLFFNVPARRKFQKSQRSEATHVEETTVRMALSAPTVDVRLMIDGKEALRAPAAVDAQHERERAELLLGRHAKGNLFAVDGQVATVRIRGFVANPAFSRGDAKGLYTFVNGRFVKDRTLTHAVMESYRTLLEVGRFPVVVLMIGLPPDAVDVNVHPQKLEVRFADSSAMHRAVTGVLMPALRMTPWLQTGAKHYEIQASLPTPQVADIHDMHAQRTREALDRYASGAMMTTPTWTSRAPIGTPGLGGAASFTRLRALGQVGLTYLVCEGPEGLVVVDQHAAHERVNFEKLNHAVKAGRVESQGLLVPVRISLTAAEEEAMVKHQAALSKAGFDVGSLGPGDAILRAAPALLLSKQPERVCKELLGELSDSGAGSPLSDAVESVLARVACHASVRAGDVLSVPEISALMEALDGVDLGAHCPHGRPVVRAIAIREVAAWFDRT